MSTFMQDDLIDGLKEQVHFITSSMPNTIELMKDIDTYKDAVAELFRSFHSLKSVSSYLGLKEVLELSTYSENILQILRSSTQITDESIFEWLYLLQDQMSLWNDELELGIEGLTPTNPQVFSLLRLASIKENPKTILKRMCLIVVAGDPVLRNYLIEQFKGCFKSIYVANNAFEAQSLIKEYSIHLVLSQFILPHENVAQARLSNTGKNALQMYKEFKSFLPTLILLEEHDAKTIRRLGVMGLKVFIKPFGINSIFSELIEMANFSYGDNCISMRDSDILKQVHKIQPLETTITKIQEICNDDKDDISLLIKLVKEDPIFSALVIKEACSPVYAQTNIDSIDTAVAFFGKRLIKAISLSNRVCSFKKDALSAYKISESDFFTIARLRRDLLMHWCTHSHKTELNTLISCISIAHMGMFVLGQHMQDKKLESSFEKTLKICDVNEAETRILSINTIDITADLMHHWGFSRRLIDLVRFSGNLNYAPEELRPLACIIHIICEVLPHNMKKLPRTLNQNVLNELKKEGIDKELLEAALLKLN